MRADPRETAALERLTQIQALRLAAHAQALDDAQQARRAAAEDEESAAEALAQQEGEMHGLLTSGAFDPLLFAMKGQQLLTHAGQHSAAQAVSEQAEQRKQDDEQRWQASRYQRDWLTARHSAAARKLHHKRDDRQALETASLLLVSKQGDHP